MAQQLLFSQGLLLIEVSRSYSDTPQLVGSLWTSDGPTQKPLPDDTQNSQETEIYAPGEIRTHNPSKRAAAYPTGNMQLFFLSFLFCGAAAQCRPWLPHS